jgi:hypothetical protein
MPYQNRYLTVNIPLNNPDGTSLDAADVTAAEYAIFDCNSVKRVDKTISNGGLTVAVVDGVNVLTCQLTPDETKHLCGQVNHEFKVATTGDEFLGVVLASPKINFIKTRI